MKKIISILFITAIFALSAQAETGYLIELKNGRTIYAEHYWEENGQIRFYQDGGVMGFPMSMVEEIREGEALPRPARQTDAIQAEQKPVEEARPDMDSHPVEPSAEIAPVTEKNEELVEQYQDELRSIHGEIVAHIRNYYAAMRENDQFVMDISRRHIEELQEKQRNLHQKTIDLHDGGTPGWWFDITEGK